HGDKKNLWELAIACLLSEATIEAAATKAGIGTRTLKEWLAEDGEFRRLYRAARQQVVEEAIARIQRATGQAVDALLKLLDADKPSVKLGAAKAILDYARADIGAADLVEQIKDLQRQLRELKEVKHGTGGITTGSGQTS